MPGRCSVPVSRLCPGCSRPTRFSGGQSEWRLTGSDTIVCERESLFTKRTWFHALIRVSFGEIPSAVIVMVAWASPGADGLDPQNDNSGTTRTTAHARPIRARVIMLTSPAGRDLYSPG